MFQKASSDEIAFNVEISLSKKAISTIEILQRDNKSPEEKDSNDITISANSSEALE